MIGDDRQLERHRNDRPPDRQPVVGDGSDSIEDITRRLDDLLQAVSDVPDPGEPPALKHEILRAARRAWQAQRERERIFRPYLVADPGWDLLLELFIARVEEREVTVRSACGATAVSEATVLRWVAQLVQAKLVLRVFETADPRHAGLALTEEGLNRMCDYFIRTSPDLDIVAE